MGTDAAGFPICVGITGHRALRAEDTDELERAVRSIFQDLRRRFPSSPIRLISSLADGADRLAARVGLECGATLVAALPMPRAEYEATFAAPHSAVEFESLLERSAETLVLDPPPAPVNGWPTREARHREHYRLFGAFLVRNAHILIALWDGVPSERPGGTADVVAMSLRGVPEPIGPAVSPLDTTDLRPVIHVLTPRQDQPVPRGSAGSIRILESGESGDDGARRQIGASRYAEVLSRIDELNRDLAKLAGVLADAASSSLDAIIPSADRPKLDSEEARLADRFATADVLARRYRSQQSWTWRALIAMVLIAYASLQLYQTVTAGGDTWKAHYRIALGLFYPAFLLLAFGCYWVAKRRGFQSKHLEYRALAEGLRVHLFWRLAGLSDEVSEHYLRKQAGELRWIREAIRTCDARARFAAGPEPDASAQRARLNLVLEHWIEDQRRYFLRAGELNARRLDRGRSVAQALYLLSIALTCGVLFADLALGSTRGFFLSRDASFVAIALTLAVSAAIEGYVEKLVVSEQTVQYARMHSLFDRAGGAVRDLVDAGDMAGARRVLRELGEEALQENGDWVLLFRARRLEVPRG